MAVTVYPSSGSFSLSAFRTKVVDSSSSVSMSQLIRRNTTTSTTTTDIQYYGTNMPWGAGLNNNSSIPLRNSTTPTPTIAISDFYGTIPWFQTRRTNSYYWYLTSTQVWNPNTKSYDTTYSYNVYWGNVNTINGSTNASSVTTGGYTYYRGTSIGSGYYYVGRD